MSGIKRFPILLEPSPPYRGFASAQKYLESAVKADSIRQLTEGDPLRVIKLVNLLTEPDYRRQTKDIGRRQMEILEKGDDRD